MPIPKRMKMRSEDYLMLNSGKQATTLLDIWDIV